MTHGCPMCGRRFEWVDDFGGRGDPTCPDCGTAVAAGPDGPRLYDREHAAQRYRPPAVAVMIVGAFVLLGGLAGPALIGGVLLLGGANNPQDRNAMIAFAAAAATSGAIALAIGGLAVFGGYRMYHLRSWGLAMAASIASMTACLGCCLFGVLGVVGLAGLPVGIWATVTLSDPQIRAAFR